MSTINGRMAREWIRENHPKNGLFRAYWTKDGNATLDDNGLSVRYEWYYKDDERVDGIYYLWFRVYVYMSRCFGYYDKLLEKR